MEQCDPKARCFSGASSPLGSGWSGKGDGRNGRSEQARVGNFPKGKNHGGLSKHAGTNKIKPTMIWGWYEPEEMQAWKLIFPLNPESKKKGWLPLSDPSWMEWECLWWIFPSDKPTKGEAKIFKWRALSPQSLARSLKDLDLKEEEEVRRVWMSKMGVVKC